MHLGGSTLRTVNFWEKEDPVTFSRRVVMLLPVAIAVACTAEKAGTFLGEPVELGYGAARMYAQFESAGSPVAIGIRFTKSMLDGLPMMLNPGSRCFDVDGNGSMDVQTECVGDWELVMPLPEELVERGGTPIQWVTLNWNPRGHVPTGIYYLAHFDFHFYMTGREAVQQMRTGTCGALMDCDDFARAMTVGAARYMPPHYVNVGAAMAAMGNHLLDTTSAEIASTTARFTRTFIYGMYDGHITFLEPMVTHEFLMSQTTECVPIKQPEAWEVGGHYATEYCIRFHEAEQEYTVSLEGFVYREAS